MLSATFPLVLHKNSPWNRNTHIGFSDDESKKHSWGGGNQKRAQRGSTWNTSQTQDIQKYSILVFCNFCSHSADRGRKSGRNTKLPSKATSVSSCFNILSSDKRTWAVLWNPFLTFQTLTLSQGFHLYVHLFMLNLTVFGEGPTPNKSRTLGD